MLLNPAAKEQKGGGGGGSSILFFFPEPGGRRMKPDALVFMDFQLAASGFLP